MDQVRLAVAMDLATVQDRVRLAVATTAEVVRLVLQVLAPLHRHLHLLAPFIKATLLAVNVCHVARH
jgi:hypothetical protein